MKTEDEMRFKYGWLQYTQIKDLFDSDKSTLVFGRKILNWKSNDIS